MERLTEHYGDGYITIKGCTTVYKGIERKGTPASNAIVRLAAYEDAMPLERAQELAKAEKDGRLVVPPCKVGDLMYEIDLPEYGIITCKVLEIHTYFGPFGHAPGNPMVSTATVSVEIIDGHGKGSGYTFETPEFGKNFFLTREEAEAALKKRAEGL